MEDRFVRCLMVETGEERTVVQLLRARDLGRGMVPQRVRIRKLRGVWRQDRIRLLPGYVFVFAEEEIPIWKYQGMEHVLKPLRYDREPEGYLWGKDLAFAKTLRELDGKMDILGAVDEEGFIRISDQLLQKMGGEVLSVDKRKRLVRIRVSLMGEPKIIQLNYQLLGADGLPLDPVAELLEDESDQWFTAWTPDFADDLADQMDREEDQDLKYSDDLDEDEPGNWENAVGLEKEDEEK